MDVGKMQNLLKGIKQVREGNTDSEKFLAGEKANQKGLKEYKNNNYGNAFRLFLTSAENGYPWGMYNVGTAYRDGEGITQDMEEAFYWIKKAAQNDIVDAMFDIGLMYYRAEGNEQDLVQAFAWCKKAAENDHVNAMNWVGSFYEDGEGVIQDFSKALEWYEKSAEGGNENAAFHAAYLYDKGADGVQPDRYKSFFWYKKAAMAGHTIAMNNLGMVYLTGNGAKIDLVYAAEWFIKAYAKADNDKSKKIYIDNFDATLKKADEDEREKIAKIMINKLGTKGAEDLMNKLESSASTDSDGCFITTAVCDNFGKPDDCYELSVFRSFRDNWLSCQPNGKKLIEEYYSIAPQIVEKINLLPNSKEIYHSIWKQYLKKCLLYIEQERFSKCMNIYVDMVRTLKEKYIGVYIKKIPD